MDSIAQQPESRGGLPLSDGQCVPRADCRADSTTGTTTMTDNTENDKSTDSRIADELPDETEKDDRNFRFSNPGATDIDAGFDITTRAGAVEIQTSSQSDISIYGPHKKYYGSETAYIQISTVVDDYAHGAAVSTVSMKLTVEAAEQLATVLGEVARAEPRTDVEYLEDEMGWDLEGESDE